MKTKQMVKWVLMFEHGSQWVQALHTISCGGWSSLVWKYCVSNWCTAINCPLDLPSASVQSCAFSRDSPNLFISSLTPSHHVFLGCPSLTLSISIVVQHLIHSAPFLCSTWCNHLDLRFLVTKLTLSKPNRSYYILRLKDRLLIKACSQSIQSILIAHSKMLLTNVIIFSSNKLWCIVTIVMCL